MHYLAPFANLGTAKFIAYFSNTILSRFFPHLHCSAIILFANKNILFKEIIITMQPLLLRRTMHLRRLIFE